MAQTAAERLAREQALEYVRLMQMYQARSSVGLPVGGSTGLAAFCHASAVQTFTEEMHFTLDEPVASRLLLAALASGANRDCIATWAASCPGAGIGSGQYVGPIPTNAPVPRPSSPDDPFWEAAFGPGNISANLVGAYKGLDHAFARAVIDIRTQRAMDLIISGAQKSAKINAHVTIYDANAPIRAKALKAGQPIPADSAAPRIRATLTNLPTTVVDPAARAALTSAIVGAERGGTNFGNAAQTKISNALITADWEKRSKFLSTKTGTGVLAFGPTLVVDLAATTTIQKGGGIKVDGQELLARTAGSQTSNLVGLLAGVAVVVFLPVTATAATVVVVGLGAGIIAQGVFGLLGADKALSNAVRDAQGRPQKL
jgi:hypothetical protein